jgi:transcriptional regulator with GAF, ATPase, and Fis domain
MSDERPKSTLDVERSDRGVGFRAHKLRAEIVAGPERGRVVEIAGPDVTVGSNPGCDLVLADPTVSRHHVTLKLDREGIRVVDAGSRNGTLLDGLRVRDAYARSDSQLVMGNSTLRLAMSADTVFLPLSARDRFGGLIGESVAMRRLFTLLERVAPGDSPILVHGETGTGKELVAEAIHEASPRASEPFVVFDCSAVAPTLVESELFGHVKGAFTGAVASRDGAFEMADGGTLFLDEIGELPLELQPRLLRALERGEVRRLGSNTFARVDVRVVAATHRSLAREMDAGRFREDLYYRLAVVEVVIPPLRERPEDIPLLAQNFADQLASRSGGSFSVPAATLRHFQSQSWPGNVRELRNAVARLMSLGAPSGQPLPTMRIDAPEQGVSFDIDLAEPLTAGRERVASAYERAYLEAALRETGNNVTMAAELARVSRKFVQRAMRRLGLRGGGS